MCSDSQISEAHEDTKLKLKPEELLQAVAPSPSLKNNAVTNTHTHMCLHILELAAAVDFEAQQNAASMHAHTPSAAGKCTSESPIHTVFAQQTTSIFFTILLPGLCHEPMHESFVRAT